MLHKLVSSVVLLSSILACGHSPKPTKAVESQTARLLETRTAIQAWAPSITVTEEGDSVLFNGIQCLGDSITFAQSCTDVKASQDATGRVWRAPARVNNDSKNSFSRDMALGFTAYLVATRDVEAASKWLSFIVASNYKLCPDADDSRCDFTPALWGTMGEAWTYLGLPLVDEMKAGMIGDDTTLYFQTDVSPAGYQLHLVAVHIYIRKAIGLNNDTISGVARKLVAKQPDNPFFQYLLGDEERATQLVLAQAPATKPEHAFQWSFQRATVDETWKNSYGQEYLFLIQLLLK